jgi:hypothetical protein
MDYEMEYDYDTEYAMQMQCMEELRAQFPRVLLDLVTVYVFDDSTIRDSTDAEKALLECRCCGVFRCGDHIERRYHDDKDDDTPFMLYTMDTRRVPLPEVKEVCSDQWHTQWQGCQHRRYLNHLQENPREDEVLWLCSTQCVARMGAWPTLGSIRAIERDLGGATIDEQRYYSLVEAVWRPVLVNRGPDGPWPFELLGLYYQNMAIMLISTSIAGEWTSRYSVCDAFGWKHPEELHVAREWPLAMFGAPTE